MKTQKSIGKPAKKTISKILPRGKKVAELKAPKLRAFKLLSESSRLERLKKARREQL